MALHADVFFDSEDWRRPLLWSAIAHVALFGGALLYGALLSGSGETWGAGPGGGGAISVELTSAVPLPSKQPTQSVLAVESTGQSISVPRVPERSLDAVPLPAPDAKKIETTKATPPPRKVEAPSARASATPPVQPEKQPENVVPFGQGGQPGGMFSSSAGSGGLNVNGGGDFAARYAWYVQQVQRKVVENWHRYEVDATVADAKRVYVSFEISRDGRPTNIQLAQSSGIPTLDRSAVRALQRIDRFPPLPDDYRGSRVSVELWFDYQK